VFDGNFKANVEKAVHPIGKALHRIGVTPDLLTATGLIMSVATAVVIGSGHPRIGFFLLVASALPDLLDGAVAKASGRASMRGAFFDSVADRATDAFLLGGIGWYLGNKHGFEASMLAFAVLGTSTLISYQRAKAEIYNLDAKGGLMERAERIIALAAGLVFPSILIPVLAVMLALTGMTAVQRFIKVWKQADAPVPVVRQPISETMAERATARRAARANRTNRLQTSETSTVAERMEGWRRDRRAAAAAREARRRERAAR
jgi:CDP-diacylglycerol---glycerol-3-phosphate 3-phosphatidyltransferase